MNLINIKKIFFFIFIFLINYFLITAFVFSFSYISLINGKTYDWFWVKSIQNKIYYRGHRNIWQFQNECVKFDKNLLYKPKPGFCNFSNPEFSTVLNFDKFKRTHNLNTKNSDDDSNFIVLGDSIAMGWGVNNNETFSYNLEKNLKKKFFNFAVSSYGTVRSIKRMNLSKNYKNTKNILIQYHANDVYENKNLDFGKIYTKKEFNNLFDYRFQTFDKIRFILRNYKSSLRLFFSDILDTMYKEKNLELIDFNHHTKFLEKIINENIDLNEKRVIVFFPKMHFQKVINFPISNKKIEYILIELDKSDVFTIDDHPNKNGHFKIAKFLEEYLLENKL